MAKQTNKEKVLTALLNTSSISEAAKVSGLSEPTLYRYLQDKSFVADYRDARRKIVENSITQLQQAAGDAVETLKRNMNCDNPSVEVRAAQIILDSAYKGVELIDIVERLEVLEDATQTKN